MNSLEYIGSLIKADGDRTKSYGGWQLMAFKKIINMEKLWKATNNKIKQRIMNVHIFNCHMDVERGPWTKTWRNAFENKWYREICWVSWTEHSTNQSIAVVKSGTCLKRQNKLFRTFKRNQPLKKLILEGQVQCQRNSWRPKILWEWCGQIVVDLTVESYRTNSRRSADV